MYQNFQKEDLFRQKQKQYLCTSNETQSRVSRRTHAHRGGNP